MVEKSKEGSLLVSVPGLDGSLVPDLKEIRFSD